MTFEAKAKDFKMFLEAKDVLEDSTSDIKRDISSLWKIINKNIQLKNVKKNNIPNKMYASKSESAQGPQAINQ